MRYLLRIAQFFGIALLSLIVLAISYPFLLRAMGYYVDVTGAEMGIIAAEKKNVELCRNIRLVWGIYPPVVERRMECVYRYASLTHDPSACELLMPSSYGWSCLGAARDLGEMCSINYGRDVSWWENTVYEPSSPSTKATMDECVHGSVKSEKGGKCCHILRVSSEKDYSDCSLFNNDKPFFDQCISQLALKLHKSDLCNSIHDANAKTICIIEVKYE